ncbi:hypothetical protein [Thalassiella azotivora]
MNPVQSTEVVAERRAQHERTVGARSLQRLAACCRPGTWARVARSVAGRLHAATTARTGSATTDAATSATCSA